MFVFRPSVLFFCDRLSASLVIKSFSRFNSEIASKSYLMSRSSLAHWLMLDR